jgi:hypothetical protein
MTEYEHQQKKTAWGKALMRPTQRYEIKEIAPGRQIIYGRRQGP